MTDPTVPSEAEYRAAKERQAADVETVDEPPPRGGFTDQNPSPEVLADVAKIRAYEAAQDIREQEGKP